MGVKTRIMKCKLVWTRHWDIPMCYKVLHGAK